MFNKNLKINICYMIEKQVTSIMIYLAVKT